MFMKTYRLKGRWATAVRRRFNSRKRHKPFPSMMRSRRMRRPTRLALMRAKRMLWWGMLYNPDLPF